MKPFISRLTIAATSLVLCVGASAQQYPDRPIRMLAAFPAGGSSDAVARMLANKLQLATGQPVTVENRVGGTGSVAVQGITGAPADGYTLLFHTSAVVIAPWLTKATYDLKDLQPVTRPAVAAYVFVIRPTLGINTLDELIAYAKKNPGKLSCSTYGVGSPPHLALEMLKKAAGISILHVPYRGFAQALPDMASGQLDCGIDTQMNYLPYVQSGGVKAIAITDDKPSKIFPEAGVIGAKYPSAKALGWQAIFVKAGTPSAVLDVLQRELRKAIQSPDVVSRMESTGFEPLGDSPETFSAAYRRDYETYGAIIKERKIAAD